MMLGGGRTVDASLPHLHPQPDLTSPQPVFICPNFIFHSHLHVMVADMILLSPTQHLLAPTSSHFDRLCHFLSLNNLPSLFIHLQSPISNSTRRQQVATLVLFTTHSHTGNLSTQFCMECYLCMRHVLVEILV